MYKINWNQYGGLMLGDAFNKLVLKDFESIDS